MQLHVFISEQDESRRADIGLRHVEDLDLLAMWYRRAVKIHSINKLIHLRSADAFASFSRNQRQRLEKIVQVFAL